MSTAPAPAWTRQRTRGGRFGLPFFALLVRAGRLGLVFVPWCLFWVALWFVLMAPAARRASGELATRLGLGGSAWRRLRFAHRHFYTFGLLLVERIMLLRGRRDLFQVEFVGEELIREALGGGRGAILVAAHLGSWEAMGHLLGRLGAPVSVVMSDAVAPAPGTAQAALEDGRSYQVLVTDGGPSSAAAILGALGQGHLVGMMGDRVLAGRGVELPFLGGRAVFPVGPYAVAAAAGAPVFHVHAVRTGRRRYRFQAWPQGVLAFSSRAAREADLARWAGDYAARLEEQLRAAPAQWGNLFPFWLPEAGPPAAH